MARYGIVVPALVVANAVAAGNVEPKLVERVVEGGDVVCFRVELASGEVDDTIVV